jgi:predicted RNase H-like nuclease (RuvC/YqgF family)
VRCMNAMYRLQVMRGEAMSHLMALLEATKITLDNREELVVDLSTEMVEKDLQVEQLSNEIQALEELVATRENTIEVLEDQLINTQQLRGPARTWWDHFLAMQPEDREVEWREFKAAFRGHHIPVGIMDRKLNEFLALTQGNRTLLQYAQAFNDMCQYAGYHADTDKKKRDRFRRGSALSSVTVSTQLGSTAIMS